MAKANDQVRKAASRWLTVEGAAAPDLPALVDGCAAHLMKVFGVGQDQAADAAIVAWAEVDGRKSGCRYDLDESSPYVVFIEDTIAGTRRAVSVVDILMLLGPRSVGRG